MPRHRRIDHPGALHFLTNRGTAQTMVFRSGANNRVFLSLLGELEDRFGVRILAFVLMGNHYHLIVESTEGRLAEAMHFLDGNYARSFNATQGRKGSLFQGRYDDRLITSETHLERAGIYVHLNPVRAGLADRPSRYRWSSMAAYRAARSPVSWLHLDLLAGRSGCEYSDLVLQELDAVNDVEPLDDDGIAAWWSDATADAEQAFAVSDHMVATAFGASTDELYIVGRRQNTARTVGIVRAAQTSGQSLRVVAERYGLRSTAAIRSARRRLRDQADQRPELAALLGDLGVDLGRAS